MKQFLPRFEKVRASFMKMWDIQLVPVWNHAFPEEAKKAMVDELRGILPQTSPPS